MGHLPHRMYVDYVRNNVPRSLQGAFLQPSSLPLDNRYSNILVTYYSLPDWLDTFSMNLDRPAWATARQYQFAIKTYKQHVTDAFSSIARWLTGRALLDEIAANAGRSVHIIPYWHKVTPSNYFDSFTAPVSGTETFSNVNGIKYDWTDGVARGASVPTGGTGTGKGADVVISYSPEMYDPKSSGRPSMPGPIDADESLFHELVHASQLLAGVLTFSPVSAGYRNEAEYIAIIISNLYLSEKGKPLRAKSDGPPRTGHEVMLGRKTYVVYDPPPKDWYLMKDPDKFYENVDGVDMSPRRLMRRFYNTQKSFFHALAVLPDGKPKFNPVKQFDQELKAGKIKP
jgi:hypothetical protein